MRVAVAGLLLWGLVLVAAAQSARAAELLMFERPGCMWCQRWLAEIGPGYPLTEEGRRAPLRRLDIREQANAQVAFERPIVVTPTFVLIDGGREIGRMTGYPGGDFFYGLLGELLARLPDRRNNDGLRAGPAAGFPAGVLAMGFRRADD
jgi:hypothetical protein